MSQAANAEWVYSTMGDDPDIGDLVETFVEKLPARVAKLRQHGEAKDWEQLGCIAHQLRGAAGSYGFDQVTAIARDLEQSCKEPCSEHEIREHLERLVNLCERLRAWAPK